MKGSLLSDVKPEHYFWLKDGTEIKNLREMHKAMKSMDDGIFKHHANEQRNDFHNWVRDVHKDRTLALRLLNSKTKEEMMQHINNRIRLPQPAKRARQQTAKREGKEEKMKPIKPNMPCELPKQLPELIASQDSGPDKPFTISGTVIALAVLVGVVALINLFGRPSITGAVVSEIDPNYNWIAIAVTIIVITTTGLILSLKKRH